LTVEALDGRDLPSSVGLVSPPALTSLVEVPHLPFQQAFHASGTFVFTSITDTTSAGIVSGTSERLGSFTGTFIQNVGDHLQGTVMLRFGIGAVIFSYDVSLDAATNVYHGTYNVAGAKGPTGLPRFASGHGAVDIQQSDTTGSFEVNGTLNFLSLSLPTGLGSIHLPGGLV
jgi:hypothetical protein